MPAGVISLGGGPELFVRVLDDQLERRRRGTCRSSTGIRAGRSTVDGLDPRLERVHESLLTLADGRLGTTRRAALRPPDLRTRASSLSGVYTGDGANTTLAPCPDWTRLGARSIEAPAREPAAGSRDAGVLEGRRRRHLASLFLARSAGTVVLRAHADAARRPAASAVASRVGEPVAAAHCATGVGDGLRAPRLVRWPSRRSPRVGARGDARAGRASSGCFASTGRRGRALGGGRHRDRRRSRAPERPCVSRSSS